jgi:hypothetical protein
MTALQNAIENALPDLPACMADNINRLVVSMLCHHNNRVNRKRRRHYTKKFKIIFPEK